MARCILVLLQIWFSVFRSIKKDYMTGLLKNIMLKNLSGMNIMAMQKVLFIAKNRLKSGNVTGKEI